jgi:ATP-dependent Lhr-like helicase
VRSETWPKASNADELHDTLLLVGALSWHEIEQTIEQSEQSPSVDTTELLEKLVHEKRETRFVPTTESEPLWIAAERIPLLKIVYQQPTFSASIHIPTRYANERWEHEEASAEWLRGRLEVAGPITSAAWKDLLHLPEAVVRVGLARLERKGCVLRSYFTPGADQIEWCDRRLLARIHRLTVNGLRAQIQPVFAADCMRFLLAWQRVDSEYQASGQEGLFYMVDRLDGHELPASA